ncbi:MAG: prenyltransferase [Anaerolineales bacterium]
MNLHMWRKALSVIPRLSKDEWDGLDIISRWLIATRSVVLVMTFISAAIAGIMAYRVGRFDFLNWLLLTIGLLMAHATNNLLNDLTDYRRGVDQDNYFRAQYGPQPLTHGFLTERQSWMYAIVTGLIALAAGAYFVVTMGSPALILLAAGAFFVLFYTYPLKYIGLGEVAVLLVWGPLMIGGGYYVITGQWDWNVVLAGLPYALGVTGVIFGKHIDKLQADKERGIHTLPVLLGEQNARRGLMLMTALQYLLVFYLVLIGFFTPVMLVVVLTFSLLRQVWSIYRQPRPDGPPDFYPKDAWPMWFVSFAFLHNRRFGTWFMLGLLVDAFLRSRGIL